MGITHEWNGTVLTITSDSGTSSADLRGEKGDTGIRGPQGVAGNDGNVSFDDLTEEQKAELLPFSTSQLSNDGDGVSTNRFIGEEDARGIANAAIWEYDYAKEPRLVKVYETTLTEATAKVTNKVEDMLDGEMPARVVVVVPPDTTFSNNYVAVQFSFSNNRNMTVRASNWKVNTDYTVGVWDCKKYAGVWDVAVTPYDKQLTGLAGDLRLQTTDRLRYANITAGGDLPVGTIIEIWGVAKQ